MFLAMLMLVRGAPHTPSVIESGVNYAKGAYISTILARFIAQLGYPAVAQHLRHYDLVLVDDITAVGSRQARGFRSGGILCQVSEVCRLLSFCLYPEGRKGRF